MRVAPGYTVASGDPDPRGLPVKAADGEVAGTIVDIWVDRSEPQVRYYEMTLANGGARKLLPIGYVQWPHFVKWPHRKQKFCVMVIASLLQRQNWCQVMWCCCRREILCLLIYL